MFVGARLERSLAEANENLVLDGDVLYFSGVDTHVSFANWDVKYVEWVQSGTWSVSFWLKPEIDSYRHDFFTLRTDKIFGIDSESAYTWENEVINWFIRKGLVKDEWYFFAVSVTDNSFTVYTNQDGSGTGDSPPVDVLNSFGPLVVDLTDQAANNMWIGSNYSGNRPWVGYATKFYFSGQPIPESEAEQRFQDSPR